MKKNRLILAVSIVVVLSIGLLVACCPATPEGPEVSEPTAVRQEEPTAEPTEEDGSPTDVPEPTAEMSPLESPLESPIESPAPLDGQVLLQERCTVCHGLERTTGASKTREEWEVTVDRMIDKGAVLSTEERDVLIDYLTEAYGAE